MKMSDHQHKNERFQRRFGLFIFLFWLTGVPVIKRKYSILSNVYFLIIIISAYSTHLAIVLDVINNTDDLQRVMESVQLAGSILSALWIHQFVRFRKDGIVKLMHISNVFIWEDLPMRDAENNYTMASMIPRIKTVVWKLCIFITVFHLIYVTLRLTFGHDRPLTMNSYYFFNTSVSPTYELVNLSQILAAAFYATMFCATMGVYGTMVAVACSQIEKLRMSLLNIKRKLVTIEQNSGAKTDMDEVYVYRTSRMFRHMQRQLNDCICHHQMIIQFMYSIEELFNPLIIGLFFLAICGICLTLFSVAMNFGNVMLMSQAFLIYSNLMIQIYGICWFGEELTTQAESVKNAAWDCDWLGTPVSFQKCLIFTIAMANKEFKLTAGKIVPVSNTTLLNIFNQTISFFMFLLKVQEKSA